MLRSTDGGGSWKFMDRDLDPDVHTIVVDPVDTNRLFIATGGGGSRSGTVKGRALYISTDAGETWSPSAMEFTLEYSVPLVMHPKDPHVLYSALANGPPGGRARRGDVEGIKSAVIRTRDSGESWEKVEKGLEETSTNFATAIVFDEENPDRLYLGLSSGELYASQDGGDSWAKLGVKAPSISDMRCVRA